MRWPFPREQGHRLAAAATLAGLAFVAQGPLFTSATFTSSASVQSSEFRTTTWCNSNSYPATVLGTAPAPRNYLRLDETGSPPASINDSAPGAPNGGQSGSAGAWGQPGLLDCVSNTAIGLDGTGQPRVWTGPPVPSPGPDAFTVTAWVDVTSGQGRLVGFGSTTGGGSPRNRTSADRMLYVDSTGHLRFGIYTDAGVRTTIQSPAVITGARHHVAATLGTDGMKLYVDGVVVAQNPSVTSGRNYRGAWRVGYDRLPTSWTGVTVPDSLPVATIDEVAVWHATLNATQLLMLASSNT